MGGNIPSTFLECCMGALLFTHGVLAVIRSEWAAQIQHHMRTQLRESVGRRTKYLISRNIVLADLRHLPYAVEPRQTGFQSSIFSQILIYLIFLLKLWRQDTPQRFLIFFWTFWS